MFPIFFVENTWRQTFFQSYRCNTCQTDVLTETTGEGWTHQFPVIPDSQLKGRVCPQCGGDVVQSMRTAKTVWRRPDTQELLYDILDHPGALFDNPQGIYDKLSGQMWFGRDNVSLSVVCPGRNVWNIDSRASNCDRPHDAGHRCWVRHGGIGDVSQLHVDKDGYSCNAGAGSIEFPDFHGFLHHGHLVAI